MTDIMSKRKRSELMSRIKCKDTSIELILLKALKRKKLKVYTYHPKIEGNPDFAFKKENVAIFCDGRFWHGKNFKEWAHKLSPFWLNKISSNIARDTKVRRKLRAKGWIVLRFWDVDIRKDIDGVIAKIEESLRRRR